MVYPNGRILHYGYSGVDDSISRVSYIADDNGSGSVGTHLEGYGYQGLGTILSRTRSETGVDEAVTLDNLDRVSRVQWDTNADDLSYAYDQDGNVTTRTNNLDATQSEAYAYDNLNQLTSFNRNSGAHTQVWGLDQLGNITGENTDSGGNVTRAHNAQNQTTGFTGSASPLFDDDGNTVSDEQGQTFTYDAWNRLSSTTKGLTTYANTYDALGRRIDDGVAGITDMFYDDQWQDIDDKHDVGSGTLQTRAQYVWSMAYVDGLVLRDRDADLSAGTGGLGKSGSGLEERLYVQQDANFNVTAITDATGLPVERYIYDAYGKPTVTDAYYTVQASSAYDWVYLHQGLRYNWDTGIYANRNRDRSTTLDTFLERDPAMDGANWYAVEADAPLTSIDSSGLVKIVIAFEGNQSFGGGQFVDIYWGAKLQADKSVEYHHYGMKEWDDAEEFLRGRALVPHLTFPIVAPYPYVACAYDSLVIIGYSNGGESALQLAKSLNNDHVKVDGVFTADPDAKPFHSVHWVKPSNVTSWDNYYEKVDGNLFGRFRGEPVEGAVNHRIRHKEIEKYINSHPFWVGTDKSDVHTSGLFADMVADDMKKFVDSMPVERSTPMV